MSAEKRPRTVSKSQPYVSLSDEETLSRSLSTDHNSKAQKTIYNRPVATSEKMPSSHTKRLQRDDIMFVKAFFNALTATNPSKHTNPRAIEERRQRKRQINRQSAMRKRIREKNDLEELSEQYSRLLRKIDELKKENESLRASILAVQQADSGQGQSTQSSQTTSREQQQATECPHPPILDQQQEAAALIQEFIQTERLRQELLARMHQQEPTSQHQQHPTQSNHQQQPTLITSPSHQECTNDLLTFRLPPAAASSASSVHNANDRGNDITLLTSALSQSSFQGVDPATLTRALFGLLASNHGKTPSSEQA